MGDERKSSKSKKEVEDKNWREVASTKHRFFRIMIHNFEHELVIPKKLTEKLKEKLSTWCTLIGPSKNKWVVKCSEREDETVAFSEGWEQFAVDHELELCDVLVFRYAGDSSFKVHIFNATACEREAAYFATSSNNNNNNNNNIHSTHEDDPLCVSDEDSDHPIGKVQMSTTNRTSARAKVLQFFHISQRRKLKPQEKLRSAAMASDYLTTINQSVPKFLITLHYTNVYRGFQLTIPKKWAKKHMIAKPHNVELRVPKKGKRSRWVVGCRWTKSSDQCHLRAQWRIFVLENNLETHDTCVFELVQDAGYGGPNRKLRPIFNVHIFRAIDHCVPLIETRQMV